MAETPTAIVQHRDFTIVPDMSGADTDAQLVELWLQGRSRHTGRAYRSDVERFLRSVAKPLRMISVADVMNFAAEINGAPTTRARTISAIKSLLSYGQRTGYLTFNVGAAIRLPKIKNTLAERILPESVVVRMLALEPDRRNHAILALLYGAGLRVSELCALKVRDLQPRDDAGQVTVFGKGGKTRAILVSATTWYELASMIDGQPPDAPVFRSRKNGGHLNTSSVLRIVRVATSRAGINEKVSPHWLRHAHASHALDHGAPPHLVQATLGHASLTTTSKYTHARPNDSSAKYLSV